MSNDTRIEIELVLNNSGVDKPLKDQEKKFGKSGKESGDNFNKGFNAGIGPLKAIVAGIGAALVSGFAVGKVIKAASQQEDAINKLNTALKITGEFSQTASMDLQNFASSLQANSKIGDEVILENMAMLKSLSGLSNEGLKPATKAALDMSAALGIDLGAAITLVGKAAVGEIGSFSRYGIIVQKGKDNAETFAKTLDVLNSKFGGAAAGQVNTFSGAYQQLENTFGDLLEEIGNLIIKSPALVGVFKFVSKSIMGAMESIKGFGSQGDVMKPIIMGVISIADAVNMFIVAPFEFAYNAIKMIVNGIATVIWAIPTYFYKAMGKVADFLKDMGIDSPIIAAIQNIRDVSSGILDEFVASTEESYDKVFEFDVAGKSATFLEGLRTSVEEAKALTEEGGNSMKNALKPDENLPYTWENIFNGIDVSMKKFEGKVQDFSKKIGQTLMQGLGASAANAFAALGTAAAKGENMLNAFLNSMLQSMGQMAIQLGSMFILEGLAMMWAGMPNGGALIGAGAALAAFGGVMGAIGGGKGGASGSGGGVAVSEPGTSPGNPVFTDPSAVQSRQEPQTNVTLNVQGDILDSDETGSRLITLLNENFESKGARLVGSYA